VIACFKCNDPIIFLDNVISERSGKLIPLDESTHEIHKCPNSDFLSQVLECRYCNENITFDNEHISKKGKKVPLDPETMEPHRCDEGMQAWNEARQKKVYCKYCLEVELTFDDEYMSPGGKHLPLDKTTGEIHQCPKRQYNPNTKIATTIF